MALPEGLGSLNELIVDPERFEANKGVADSTGIFVRARWPNDAPSDGVRFWDSHDIQNLTKESLLEWLRSRPNFAEDTVLLLLGYERDPS